MKAKVIILVSVMFILSGFVGCGKHLKDSATDYQADVQDQKEAMTIFMNNYKFDRGRIIAALGGQEVVRVAYPEVATAFKNLDEAYAVYKTGQEQENQDRMDEAMGKFMGWQFRGYVGAVRDSLRAFAPSLHDQILWLTLF